MTTISKVAERAGVSRTTVSHVLNHADRVSETLRERVMQAVAELGYVPNPHARSLRTGKTNMVALLIPDIANPFYPDLVLTAQAALEAAGLDTMIFNSDVPGGHPQEHSREYLRRIRALRVDGLIATDFSLHGMHEALLQVDVPAVFIGRLPNRAVDNVRADDFGGGYLMGRYLAGRGHRRVAHVTGPSFFGEAMQRAEGFERGLAEHGAPPDPALRFEGTYLAPSGPRGDRLAVRAACGSPSLGDLLRQLPDGDRRPGRPAGPADSPFPATWRSGCSETCPQWSSPGRVSPASACRRPGSRSVPRRCSWSVSPAPVRPGRAARSWKAPWWFPTAPDATPGARPDGNTG